MYAPSSFGGRGGTAGTTAKGGNCYPTGSENKNTIILITFNHIHYSYTFRESYVDRDTRKPYYRHYMFHIYYLIDDLNMTI